MKQALSPNLRGKKRPRGKPFPKGNLVGLDTRFPKGVAQNTGGRPRSQQLHAAIRFALAASTDEPLPLDTNAEVIAKQIIRKAKKGDLAAAQIAGDRAEGRPAVSVTVGDGKDALELLLEEMRAEYGRISAPTNALPAEVEQENSDEIG
jgi:hypothetical protein